MNNQTKTHATYSAAAYTVTAKDIRRALRNAYLYDDNLTMFAIDAVESIANLSDIEDEEDARDVIDEYDYDFSLIYNQDIADYWAKNVADVEDAMNNYSTFNLSGGVALARMDKFNAEYVPVILKLIEDAADALQDDEE